MTHLFASLFKMHRRKVSFKKSCVITRNYPDIRNIFIHGPARDVAWLMTRVSRCSWVIRVVSSHAASRADLTHYTLQVLEVDVFACQLPHRLHVLHLQPPHPPSPIYLHFCPAWCSAFWGKVPFFFVPEQFWHFRKLVPDSFSGADFTGRREGRLHLSTF